jgi:hypothetical protein
MEVIMKSQSEKSSICCPKFDFIPDYVCLSEHTSKWNMDVYLAVDREILDK